MQGGLSNTSLAETEGIRVSVKSSYIAEQSEPRNHYYRFAYTVRIENRGELPVYLRSRHWIITDNNGKVDEVRGAGVVGEEPLLQPGMAFEYRSGCILTTPRGEMHGTYQMERPDGTLFDALIAPFVLVLPYSLN